MPEKRPPFIDFEPPIEKIPIVPENGFMATTGVSE